MTIFKTLVFTVSQNGAGQGSSEPEVPSGAFQPPNVAAPYFVPTPTFGPMPGGPPNLDALEDLFEQGGGRHRRREHRGGRGFGGGLTELSERRFHRSRRSFGQISNIQYPHRIIPNQSFNILTRFRHRGSSFGTYVVRVNLPQLGVSHMSEPVNVSSFAEGVSITTVTIPHTPNLGRGAITGSVELIRSSTGREDNDVDVGVHERFDRRSPIKVFGREPHIIAGGQFFEGPDDLPEHVNYDAPHGIGPDGRAYFVRAYDTEVTDAPPAAAAIVPATAPLLPPTAPVGIPVIDDSRVIALHQAHGGRMGEIEITISGMPGERGEDEQSRRGCVQNKHCMRNTRWHHRRCKCVRIHGPEDDDDSDGDHHHGEGHEIGEDGRDSDEFPPSPAHPPREHRCAPGTRYSPCFGRCMPAGVLEPNPLDPRCKHHHGRHPLPHNRHSPRLTVQHYKRPRQIRGRNRRSYATFNTLPQFDLSGRPGSITDIKRLDSELDAKRHLTSEEELVDQQLDLVLNDIVVDMDGFVPRETVDIDLQPQFSSRPPHRITVFADELGHARTHVTINKNTGSNKTQVIKVVAQGRDSFKLAQTLTHL